MQRDRRDECQTGRRRIAGFERDAGRAMEITGQAAPLSPEPSASGGLALRNQPLPADALAIGYASEQIGVGRACFGNELDVQSSDPAAVAVTPLSGAIRRNPMTLT